MTKSPLEFKKITHKDMDIIWPFLQKENGRTTDFSYAGLFMWVDFFKYEYAVYENTLFVKGVVENDRSIPAFSLPIGDLPLSECIRLIKDYCRQHSVMPVLSAVPEYAMKELRDLNPIGEELLEHWSDYLYDASMLASLAGKKMNKKRNHVNHFCNLFPDWSFQKLSSCNAAAALDFMDLYESGVEETIMAREESRLCRQMINMITEGDNVMKGGLLYSDPDNICALTIGDIKGDTLFVHIEKALRSVPGSYEMINHAFASHILEQFPEIKFINREDDAGEEGLKKAKESYHPVDLLKKFNVIF